ncbi:MAG TPA: hypothetical protein DCO79_14285 [Spirochaeta sp.]|nr:hypothetical protein [Spirochaeta sp.]
MTNPNNNDTVEKNIILASSLNLECETLIEIIQEKKLPYRIHQPQSLKEFDEISKNLDISLIITDLEFQNGSLVDWLSLWPYPFILLAYPDSEDKIDAILTDEASCFIVRREDNQHIRFIPNMINKVLHVKESRSVQNSYIKVSEKQYMNLVQILPDIIYVLDSDGHFTFINNTVRSLGWEPMELIGKHFSILLFEEDVPKVSRNSILPGLRGRITGNDRAPKLFDERRTGSRMTRGLRLKLKRKPTLGGSMNVSLTSYGEISSIGYTGFQSEEIEGLGTAGVIRENRNSSHPGTSDINVESIFNTEGALTHDEVMHLINNKLQVLSSLVSLKQNLCSDSFSRSSLNEVQIQIYTLSLVYQNMVTVDGKVCVQMDSYIDDIIKHLVSSYAGNPWIQQIDVHCDSVHLDEDPAITVSLFISELLTIFLKLEEVIKKDCVPVSITLLVNEGIAQMKLRTSEEIFAEYQKLSNGEDHTLIVTTLVEILNGEIFMDKGSLTLFFNID